MRTVNYTDPALVESVTCDNCRPYGQSPSGYGRKIAMPYTVRYLSRVRRVYCTIFSNSGCLWIQVKGSHLYLDSYTEDRLQEARDDFYHYGREAITAA